MRTYVLPDFVPSSSNKLGYVRLPRDSSDPTPSPPPTAPTPPVDDKGKAVAGEEEQLLQLGNERFAVPEVLFNPSTIGQSLRARLAANPRLLNLVVDLNQAGLPETIAHSIAALPAEVQGMFWANIKCVGGNTAFKGFAGRL